jgi:hypothetical protein
MAGPAPASPAPRLAVRVASPLMQPSPLSPGRFHPARLCLPLFFQSGIPAGCDFLLRVQNFIYHVDFI